MCSASCPQLTSPPPFVFSSSPRDSVFFPLVFPVDRFRLCCSFVASPSSLSSPLLFFCIERLMLGLLRTFLHNFLVSPVPRPRRHHFTACTFCAPFVPSCCRWCCYLALPRVFEPPFLVRYAGPVIIFFFPPMRLSLFLSHLSASK